MALEWVAPTSGGVVALGGIVLAYLSSRRAIDTTERLAAHTTEHDLAVRRREERLTAYLRYLDAVSSCDTLHQELRLGRPVDVVLLRSAAHRALQAHYGVGLVGPTEVAKSSSRLIRLITGNLESYESGLRGGNPENSSIQSVGNALGLLHYEMSQVLGYETPEDADQLRTSEANPK